MKRRSARPFMVEVKSTRTARASLTPPTLRTRPETPLWPELVEAAAKPPQPGPPLPAPPRQERAEAPVRRVLPSLVPMFQTPAEVEAEAEAVAPLVRRSRTRGKRPSAVAKGAAGKAAAEEAELVASPAVETAPAAPEPAAAPAPAPCGQAAGSEGPAIRSAARPATWRRTKELGLGERWKRRLPYFAR